MAIFSKVYRSWICFVLDFHHYFGILKNRFFNQQGKKTLNHSKDPKELVKNQLEAATQSLKRAAKASTDTHAVLMQAFDAYKESKNLKSYKTVEAEAMKQYAQEKSEMLKVVKTTENVDEGYSKRASLIQILHDERMNMTCTYHAKMLEFISKASAGVSENSKKEMMKTVDDFEKDVAQIDDKLKKAELNIN